MTGPVLVANGGQVCILMNAKDLFGPWRFVWMLHRHHRREGPIQPFGARALRGQGPTANKLLHKGGLLFVSHVEKVNLLFWIKEVGVYIGSVFGEAFERRIASHIAVLPLPDMDHFMGKKHGCDEVDLFGVTECVIGQCPIGIGQNMGPRDRPCGAGLDGRATGRRRDSLTAGGLRAGRIGARGVANGRFDETDRRCIEGVAHEATRKGPLRLRQATPAADEEEEEEKEAHGWKGMRGLGEGEG